MGSKTLSPTNWLEPDIASSMMLNRDPSSDATSPMSGTDWLNLILEPRLHPDVPEEVKGMYETARAVITYGWFYYPMITLGAEQLYRVLEAAASHKCKSMNAPSSVKTFDKKLNWLNTKCILTDEDVHRWTPARTLRNIASHAKFQALHLPSYAIQELENAANDINSLFRKTGNP